MHLPSSVRRYPGYRRPCRTSAWMCWWTRTTNRTE